MIICCLVAEKRCGLGKRGDTLHFFCTFAELQQRGFACMNFLIL